MGEVLGTMAGAFSDQLFDQLLANCQSVEDLDKFVLDNGLDQNDPSIVQRRNVILQNLTDTALSTSILSDVNYSNEIFQEILSGFKTVKELDEFALLFGVGAHDKQVLQRRREILQRSDNTTQNKRTCSAMQTGSGRSSRKVSSLLFNCLFIWCLF